MKLKVQIINSEGISTTSRPMDSQNALEFAERIWQANSLKPITSIQCVDNKGNVYSEWES
jgi:hypothetical protein